VQHNTEIKERRLKEKTCFCQNEKPERKKKEKSGAMQI
jgi:hypothetical protein